MTTQAKLSRLIETKNAIRQKLISLGVDVPMDTPFEDYAELIKQLGGAEFIETTTDQELLQLLDLYKWLSTNEYEDYTYTDTETRAIHDLLDRINNGPSDEKTDAPVILEPRLTVISVGRTVYYPGDIFNLNGYIIKLVYPDGNVVDVTELCAFAPTTPLTTASESVTISCTIDDVVFEYVQPIKTYKLLDYIQSSGTQYIDTGVIVTLNTRVEFKITDLSTQTQQYPQLFGVQVKDNGTDRFGVSHGWNARTGSTTITVNTKVYDKPIEGSLRLNEYILNGVTYTATGGFNLPTISLFLFSCHSQEGGDIWNALHGHARIHYFKIYEGDTLIRDYIPIKDFDGVACLRDLVSETYVRNAGSGTFIAGPEITVEEVEQ